MKGTGYQYSIWEKSNFNPKKQPWQLIIKTNHGGESRANFFKFELNFNLPNLDTKKAITTYVVVYYKRK